MNFAENSQNIMPGKTWNPSEQLTFVQSILVTAQSRNEKGSINRATKTRKCEKQHNAVQHPYILAGHCKAAAKGSAHSNCACPGPSGFLQITQDA